MRFLSTRDASVKLTGAQVIVKGLSDEGGLFVPESFPLLASEEMRELCGQDYAARAAFILGKFLGDEFSRETLARITRESYGAAFAGGKPAPVHILDKQTALLELFHGPTCAFKDLALQLLPRLMVESKRILGDESEVCILAATSGDTGKAALEGFRDVAGTRCIVFYPETGVSPAQRMQMITQAGSNVKVFAVKGNFDDAQRGVKRIFASAQTQQKAKDKGFALSSANSINFGRLVPQIVYYFSAYCDLVNTGAITFGDSIDFAVPTGNFGDILAGIYAQRMGLPARRFLCCSNRNRILYDFLQTGVYDARREFYKTTSPSMDILVSSNLERLLFECCGRNAETVRAWMQSLASEGVYCVDEKTLTELKRLLVPGWADDEMTAQAISDTYKTFGYVADTHTAVALNVLKGIRAKETDTRLTVVVSTASPFKFSRDVCAALGLAPAAEAAGLNANAEMLEKATGLAMPEAIRRLPELPILHRAVIAPEEMESAVLES